MEVSTAAETRLPYPFLRFDGVPGEKSVGDKEFVGVCSSKEPLRECPGVRGRVRFQGAEESRATIGLGRGVRSDIVARKGDGRAEFADPGERDADILAVESEERSEEPLAGNL
jgi:hypothetical protein